MCNFTYYYINWVSITAKQWGQFRNIVAHRYWILQSLSKPVESQFMPWLLAKNDIFYGGHKMYYVKIGCKAFLFSKVNINFKIERFLGWH